MTQSVSDTFFSSRWKTRTFAFVTLLLFSFLLPDVGHAQPYPKGGEFLVNTTTADYQETSPQGRSVAMHPDGHFVVAWMGRSPATDYDIYIQRYSASAVPQGGETIVNTTTEGGQWYPAIAMAPSGEFIVAWVSSDGSGQGVFAQRFDASGNPMGPEFAVNTTTENNQNHPSIAIAADGSFVIVWAGVVADPNTNVYAQYYDPTGAAAGPQQLVNVSLNWQQHSPDIAALGTGGFVVVYENDVGSFPIISGRRLSATGAPVGGEFKVNTIDEGSYTNPSVAADGAGNFAVVWAGSGWEGYTIRGRTYNPSGSPIESEDFSVNASPFNVKYAPTIASYADVRFVVTWVEPEFVLVDTGLTTSIGIAGRLISVGSGLDSSQFWVNSTVRLDEQVNPAVGCAPDGFVIAWSSANQDGDGWGVYARRFSFTNVAPVASSDTLLTAEDTPGTVNVVANDTDADGDVLAVTSYVEGTSGSVSCTEAGSCTYTPAANWSGSDSFTYTVSDGSGTATGTVDVTVSPVNDAPVANPDSITTAEDTDGTVNVLTNDGDVESNPLSVTANTQGLHGRVARVAGDCTYSPDANWNGPDSFSYTVSDGNGGTATGTVSVTVSAVNDAPLANADSITTAEDTTGSVNVLTNDVDADHDPLSLTGNTNGTNGTVACVAGVCTYTPNANWFGNDSFTYSVSDGNGGTATATVSLDVAAVNDAPVADADSIGTNEDTPGSVNVLTNDTDLESDPLSVTANTNGANGIVSCVAGVCTYTPNPNWYGTDSFAYTVSDGNGGTATTMVRVDVAAVNDAPLANADRISTMRSHPATFNVLANDFDVDGDALTLSSATSPALGTLSCTPTGECTYTPPSETLGTDEFTYTVSDGNGGTAVATVDIEIVVMPEPLAADDPVRILEDTSGAVNVLANDHDPAGGILTLIAATQPRHGTSSCTPAGDCVYVPAPDYFGADTFTYEIRSSESGRTAAATVRVGITAVNDTPLARSDHAAVESNGSVTIDVIANDSDADGDLLSIISTTPAAHGTVSCTTAGVCTYTANVAAPSTDSFSYTVTDSHGGEATAVVRIEILKVAPNVSTIAVVGSAPGAFGSFFRTSLILHNGSSGTMRGALQFVPEELPGGKASPAALSYEIGPGAAKHYADIVAELGETGIGSLDVTANEGGLPLVVARVFNDAGDNGTTGMTQDGHHERIVLVEGETGLLFVPANFTRYRFNIGVRTFGSGATLRIEVRAADGSLLRTIDRTFMPDYFLQQPATEITGDLAPSSALRVTILEGSAIVYGTTADNVTQDPTIQFAQPAGARAPLQYLAVAGSTPGAHGSFYRTALQLHNMSSEPANGRIVFHAQGVKAKASDASWPFTLGANETVSLDDLLPLMGTSGIGSVDLITDSGAAPVAAASVYNDAGEAGTCGLSEVAMPGTDALQTGETATLLAPADLVLLRMNIGVRTLDRGATMRITLRTVAGEVVRSVEKDYPENWFEQVAVSAFTGASLSGGESLTVEMLSGEAFVYASTSDNRTNDPAIQFAEP